MLLTPTEGTVSIGIGFNSGKCEEFDKIGDFDCYSFVFFFFLDAS